jgi:hypothetical protein
MSSISSFQTIGVNPAAQANFERNLSGGGDASRQLRATTTFPASFATDSIANLASDDGLPFEEPAMLHRFLPLAAPICVEEQDYLKGMAQITRHQAARSSRGLYTPFTRPSP